MTCACDGLEYGMTEENHKKEKEYYTEQKQNSITRLRANYARKRIEFLRNQTRSASRPGSRMWSTGAFSTLRIHIGFGVRNRSLKRRAV